MNKNFHHDLFQLLVAIRDRAIEVEDGERRHHQTDDDLIITAWRFIDNTGIHSHS